MTLLSAAVDAASPLSQFLKPSDCFQVGLCGLVRNHSLQLSPASKQFVEKEEADRQLLLHFGLLLFDGDVEKARMFVNEEMKKGGDGVKEVMLKEEVKEVKEVKEEKEMVKEEDVKEEKEKKEEEEETLKEVKKEEEKEEEEKEEKNTEETQKTTQESPTETTPVPSAKPSLPTLSTKTQILGASPTPMTAESLPKSFAKTTATPKGRRGVLLRFHPKVRDFFDWWLDDKLDKGIVETSMKDEGIDPGVGERGESKE